MSRFDALVDACHKRSRPIIMTTIAMGAGMMPLALGWGADPSFRSPMAIAVIGGLITSTLLSLLVVPAVSTYIDDRYKFNSCLHILDGGYKPERLKLRSPHAQLSHGCCSRKTPAPAR